MQDMSNLRNLSLLLLLAAQYFRHRFGLGGPPEVDRYYSPGLAALDWMFGWSRKARVVGEANCRVPGPAIFAGNHIAIDDPFVTGNLIHWITGRRIRVRIMMRDDFFRGLPAWVKKIVDPDEATRYIGAIQIPRRNADAAQLEPFVRVLCEGGSFLIYPGRTRSRSGMFAEYRDWVQSPGATSYFLAEARRICPDTRVSVIPVGRTCNPVTGCSTIIFGTALYLPADAQERSAWRAFDRRLMAAMSELVEVNVPHVLGEVLYLCALHDLPAPISVTALAGVVGEVFARIKNNRYVDPAARADLEGEVSRALRFFESRRMLRREGDTIRLDRAAILAVPACLDAYKKENPLKHLANQIIHLTDVTHAVHEALFNGTDSGAEGGYG